MILVHLQRRVFLVLALAASATGGARPALAQSGGALVIRQLKFEGNESLSPALLAASIATTNSAFFASSPIFRWIGLGEKRYLNERDLKTDVERLSVLYRRSGFPDVAVDTLVRRTEEDAFITFQISEGEPQTVDSVTVTGLDTLSAEAEENVALDLPLRPGDVFDRYRMQASADSITRRLRDRGFPTAEVLTGYDLQLEERIASVTLDAHLGRRAEIGQVRVEGEERIDSSTVVSLLTARPGRRYSRSDLFESQRNLYRSDLFRLASVDIDTALFEPGDSLVPLVVQVVESEPRRVEAGVGYGTNDCFRGNTGLRLRNFLGAGRVVDLSARVAKVGIGAPLDWGLEESLCSPLKEDSIGSSLLNYNFTAALRRPAFLSPNNTLILTGFADRTSEFKIFRRQEVGASVGITRETPRRRLPLALTYTLAYGRTVATPFSFCAFFNACRPADVEFRSRSRRIATITATASIPRANNPVDPSRGYVVSGEVTVASRFIGSSSVVQFSRVVGEYAWYHPLARDVVFSWRVRGGFTYSPVRFEGSTVGFVPPEQRFYGGGANDVRGFQRNELGPVVYRTSREHVTAQDDTAGGVLEPDSVFVSATGGNTLAVANAEVRFPSPIFSQRLRLALFVDAGGVWERGATDPLIRVTPGVGIRVATPLGPARLDLAYNAYRLSPGTLYIIEPDNTLTADHSRSPYTVERTRHFTLHFAVGQPF